MVSRRFKSSVVGTVECSVVGLLVGSSVVGLVVVVIEILDSCVGAIDGSN
jgi:hypothetical protein